MSDTKFASWLIGGTFAVLAAMSPMQGLAQESGLILKNVRAISGRVEFTLENRTDLSGDVVLWVVQNGVQVCAVVTEVKFNRPYNLGFQCGQMADGNFDLSVDWADKKPEIATSAQRM